MNWYDWHAPYDDPGSPLARRLRLVQRHIAAWLDGRPEEPLSVLSMCAGQGRDVLGTLAGRPDAGRVRALPQLCAPGATVIWTRTRRPPDLTPAIRRWLADAGFVERSFDAPDDVLFTVGVHHFTGEPRPLPAEGRIFRFV